MQVFRTFTKGTLPEILSLTPELVDDSFDLSEWLQDRDNILLTDGKGSYALFEKKEVSHEGHYFFTVRGKEAISLAKSFLSFLFDNNPSINIITGHTPLDKRGARKISRLLGFSSLGIINEGFELFMMTRSMWKELSNNG